MTFFNPFDTEVEHATLTLDGNINFFSNDEFYLSKSDGTTTTYTFYNRDSGNKFVTSGFTISKTGSDSEKQTNVVFVGPKMYRDYLVTYDKDNTADKNPLTLSLWNKSGTAAFEKQAAEEGVNYTFDDDSTTSPIAHWLDAK